MEAKDYVLHLKNSGLTQMQISELTGIHQSSISKIENGVVSDVGSKSYRALQSVYLAHLKPKTTEKAEG